MRKTKFLVLVTTCIGLVTLISQTTATYLTPQPTDSIYSNQSVVDSSEKDLRTSTEILYDEIGLEGKLKFEAFEKAMIGYENLDFKNKDIITVIDFTLPSTEKRMHVIDIKNKKVLYNTIVSHGRNSGEKYATAFSNRHGSFQSSLGFYTTENTYMGGNGYSLVLNGLEKGINDQAKPRAVVIHGADYCSQSVINSTGRLGRSYGCPALPRELNKPIINTIKNGTMVFIYAEDPTYLASSKILKKSSNTLLAQRDVVSDVDSAYSSY
ncbi:murein L,D-transpeptidase catalytic domain family protein [Sphingobacterium composti Ten et al. 2007 non Yoo et al. 2007]|uniref:murein L,D-transpeptidase catalytic domain family protein n=1 Tax=Sphingobacterium composti TaxID=363260 RepID=UPI00135C41D1|nr:murein L,D-transpeptidase catalytic domain family protein [Sphingobacterium composti Ten et al. 2007 non Yoo et al. 2007]